MYNINLEIFDLINRYAAQSSLMDATAIAFAKYLIFILPIYLTFLFLKKDNYFKQQSLYAFYTGSIGLILNFLISLLYFYPRPFMIHIGHLLIPHSYDTSFPSDHTTLILSIGFYLLFLSELKIQGIVISIIGVLVGLARVFCGLHWPMDIIGSGVVAMLSVLLILSVRNYLYKVNNFIIATVYKVINTKQRN